jgi:ComF family protein
MIGRLGRELLRGARQLIFPNLCMICEQAVPVGHETVCPACREALTADPHRVCPRCTSSIGEFAALEGTCAHCGGASFHFDQAFRLGVYGGILREVILRMKYGGDEILAATVGSVWADHWAARFRAVEAQVVVPVPLHWWRRWRRGYNQSEPLAVALAGRLGLPCETRSLRRIRYTRPQTNQSATARRENMRGAFRSSGGVAVRGRTILLIDDVLTTGSTVSEAARALKAAGAARVVAAVLAHRQRDGRA